MQSIGSFPEHPTPTHFEVPIKSPKTIHYILISKISLYLEKNDLILVLFPIFPTSNSKQIMRLFINNLGIQVSVIRVLQLPFSCHCFSCHSMTKMTMRRRRKRMMMMIVILRIMANTYIVISICQILGKCHFLPTSNLPIKKFV